MNLYYILKEGILIYLLGIIYLRSDVACFDRVTTEYSEKLQCVLEPGVEESEKLETKRNEIEKYFCEGRKIRDRIERLVQEIYICLDLCQDSPLFLKNTVEENVVENEKEESVFKISKT